MIPIHVILTLVGYFIFSAAVGAMIEPTEEQKRGFYGWLFRFAQILAANADRLAAAKFGAGIAGAAAAAAKADHAATAISAGEDSDAAGNGAAHTDASSGSAEDPAVGSGVGLDAPSLGRPDSAG
jgi:hypothetical protein